MLIYTDPLTALSRATYLTFEVFCPHIVLVLYGSSLMLYSYSGFIDPILSSGSSAALLNLLRNPAGLLAKAV